MWLYVQATGALYDPEGVLQVHGYSGHAEGLNNPLMQNVHATGPLPQGFYTINAPQTPIGHLGPIAMFLAPDESNTMFGRSAFFMHGDNSLMNRSASDGCIIMPVMVRGKVNASSDKRLCVVQGEAEARAIMTT